MAPWTPILHSTHFLLIAPSLHAEQSAAMRSFGRKTRAEEKNLSLKLNARLRDSALGRFRDYAFGLALTSSRNLGFTT